MPTWYFSFRPTQRRNEGCQLMTRCSQLLGWVQMTLIWIFCQIKWRIHRLHSGGMSIACGWRNWKATLSGEHKHMFEDDIIVWSHVHVHVYFTCWHIRTVLSHLYLMCTHLTGVVSMVEVVIIHPKCVLMSIHLYRCGRTVLISVPVLDMHTPKEG